MFPSGAANKLSWPHCGRTCINASSNVLEATDYKKQLEGIAKAKAGLEKNIKQRELVTNPAEGFVVKRLANVEHVVTPTAVTEDHDPNGLLHKQGGYNATVYFACDLADQSKAIGDNVIDKGTDGGGAVEVYPDEAGVEARDKHLASFDAEFFPSGSHVVCGTCVVRTSNLLTATQQKELTQAIIDELTRLD